MFGLASNPVAQSLFKAIVPLWRVAAILAALTLASRLLKWWAKLRRSARRRG